LSDNSGINEKIISLTTAEKKKETTKELEYKMYMNIVSIYPSI